MVAPHLDLSGAGVIHVGRGVFRDGMGPCQSGAGGSIPLPEAPPASRTGANGSAARSRMTASPPEEHHARDRIPRSKDSKGHSRHPLTLSPPDTRPGQCPAAALRQPVSTAQAVREHHGRDESPYPLTPPEGVVFAESTQDVVDVVNLCREHGCPIIPWGAGSSIEGQLLPVQGGITLGPVGHGTGWWRWPPKTCR